MTNALLFLNAFITIFNLSDLSSTCTAFTLQHDNTIILGKNLDWPVGDGYLIINKRGVEKEAMVEPEENPVRWISRYGSVTFNQFGVEFPLGGINEAGLVIEELSYSPSVYPNPNGMPVINELQWIQFQLDNYTTVEEVLNNLSQPVISRFMFGLHYFLCDRSGTTAVLEFVDGRVLSYTGESLPVSVLANDTYGNSIKYLQRHQGFGGDRAVGDGPESPERFVRAATRLKVYNTDPADNPLEFAFATLDHVRQTDTQWSLIYDIGRRMILYRTGWDPSLHRLRMSDLDFSSVQYPYYIDLKKIRRDDTFPDDWSQLTEYENGLLIQNVLDQLVMLQDIDRPTAEGLRNKWSGYIRSCPYLQRQDGK